jgi:hypothetical protein
VSKIICLDGTNYHKWKGNMRDLLVVKRLHLTVFVVSKPESKSDEDCMGV